jgi:undecaprenyl diphosphate synthase
MAKHLSSTLELQVKARPLPRHVGIIMDGNGRWAEALGKPRFEGHREGSNSVREVTRCARRVGLEALTLYAFSAQNWDRPSEEVAVLMDLLREYLESEREEILENGIRLNAIGELEKLPWFVREPLDQLRVDSQANRGMVLTLALSYGGREELVQATRKLCQKVASRQLVPEQVSAAEVEASLWTSDLPALDLCIRTSGERRISNFLLWQVAYAELAFTDTLWPEFRSQSLLECLADYQQRERRFGKTSAQVRAQ